MAKLVYRLMGKQSCLFWVARIMNDTLTVSELFLYVDTEDFTFIGSDHRKTADMRGLSFILTFSFTHVFNSSLGFGRYYCVALT